MTAETQTLPPSMHTLELFRAREPVENNSKLVHSWRYYNKYVLKFHFLLHLDYSASHSALQTEIQSLTPSNSLNTLLLEMGKRELFYCPQ